ncbi:claudin-9-like [Anolis sagrei]|uniref:claudin-9-like n=1 Tax=Anolis sagrei TaxID=38937 RepID=UPI003520B26C
MLALQLLGLALSALGLLGAVLACALPMWKVTAFGGANIIVAQVFWEGLWMSCVYQSTGQMQCKVYDNLLELPPDLQAARASAVASVASAILALLLAVSGADCTHCVDGRATKAKIVATSGVLFVLSALALLVPVSWSAHSIIRNFYNPMVPEALKRELGVSLYVGWAASGLLVLGGAALSCVCLPKDSSKLDRVRYRVQKQAASESYAHKDYV